MGRYAMAMNASDALPREREHHGKRMARDDVQSGVGAISDFARRWSDIGRLNAKPPNPFLAHGRPGSIARPGRPSLEPAEAR